MFGQPHFLTDHFGQGAHAFGMSSGSAIVPVKNFDQGQHLLGSDLGVVCKAVRTKVGKDVF
jgi:hypothetical protein